tara:strand:- start:58 stop:954 length:897 start_codon:yes stop_codon:yes gene_type:complete
MSEEDLKEDDNVEVELAEETVEETVEFERTTTSDKEPVEAKGEGELEDYSKNVQKRIKKLTEKYRQEERDKEEASRLAQTLRDENVKLKSQMANSQQAHLSEYGSRIENQLGLAKQAYKDAHDRGDVDQMFEAQQSLSKISIEQERYRLAKNQQERVKVQQQDSENLPIAPQEKQPSQTSAAPDPRAQDWATKNEWFGQDDVMTYAAFALHKRLVEEEGFDPTSEEYYNEIDRKIRGEFPHKFNGHKNGRSGQVASADTSASRKTTSGRRRVKLSPSQVAIAKKLGVPLEEYAKYVKD